MVKKTFSNIFLVSLTVLLVAVLLMLPVLYASFETTARAALRSETEFVAAALDASGTGYFAELGDVDARITLIAPDGSVLYDSDADETSMGNHGDRPEIRQAFERGVGEITRESTTFDTTNMYYALRLDNGSVVRLSTTLSSILGMLIRITPAIVLVMAGAALLSVFLAKKLSQRIIAPLDALDLDDPLNTVVYDELTPLMVRIDRQNARIREQVADLTRRQEELEVITGHMGEGLVLLDANAGMLLINKSAAKLFGVSAEECEGQHIMSLADSPELKDVVERALSGSSASNRMSQSGRTYQLYASPVLSEGGGAVLLIMDITESMDAEKLRREFSANVSHELKTPLTSIAGYAEIIENGMVQPQDVPDFAGRIHEEAERLVVLIDDIIRISRLDENSVPGENQPVDLYDAALDVCSGLGGFAAQRGVSLNVSGSHEII